MPSEATVLIEKRQKRRAEKSRLKQNKTKWVRVEKFVSMLRNWATTIHPEGKLHVQGHRATDRGAWVPDGTGALPLQACTACPDFSTRERPLPPTERTPPPSHTHCRNQSYPLAVSFNNQGCTQTNSSPEFEVLLKVFSNSYGHSSPQKIKTSWCLDKVSDWGS